MSWEFDILRVEIISYILMLKLPVLGYIPAFGRDEVTESLQALVGQRLDIQRITKKAMKGIVGAISKPFLNFAFGVGLYKGGGA